MGRVRRYKKFKACDPFSKKSSAPIDTVHDEPPEMFEQRSKRKENRFKNNLGVDDEDDEYEKYIRRAMLKSASTSEKDSKVIKKIDPKREDESAKAFKQRIRQETRIALNEELRGMSATAKKRKENLRERSQKRKAKPDTTDEEVDLNEFSAREDGYMRASDLAGPSSFPTTEPVTFGETLNRLPDLAKWKHALSKKMTGKEISLNLKLSRSNQLLAADQGTEVEHVDNDDDLKDGNMESQKRSKKRKQQSILDRLNVDDTVSGVAYSDDFLSHSTLAMHNPLTQYLKGKSSSKNQAIQKSKTQVSNDSQSQNVAKAFELGKIREQSRLAYQQLKAKRKLVDR